MGVLTTGEGVYKGNFDMGRMTGIGRFEYKSGIVYEGQWKNGLWHGQGRLETHEAVYTGNFKVGFLEGKGTLPVLP